MNKKNKDLGKLVLMGINTFISSSISIIAGALILGCILLGTITFLVIIAVPLAAISAILFGVWVLADYFRNIHEYKKKWK